MPRSMLKDPAEVASVQIFGRPAQPANLSEISRRTGIAKATLSRRRKDPRTMSLAEFAKIAKVLQKTDAEIAEIIRGLMR